MDSLDTSNDIPATGSNDFEKEKNYIWKDDIWNRLCLSSLDGEKALDEKLTDKASQAGQLPYPSSIQNGR
jgi:hypothetical protein